MNVAHSIFDVDANLGACFALCLGDGFTLLIALVDELLLLQSMEKFDGEYVKA